MLAASGGILAAEVGFDREVNQEIEIVLADEEYEELELVSVETQLTDAGLAKGDRRISIVVNRPADRSVPDLVDRLERRIADRTGTDVHVEIEYLETDSASSG